MVFKMVIKKTAVGNIKEAFVENGFSDGINIISSDDNNKGKTIVIQSMNLLFRRLLIIKSIITSLNLRRIVSPIVCVGSTTVSF